MLVNTNADPSGLMRSAKFVACTKVTQLPGPTPLDQLGLKCKRMLPRVGEMFGLPEVSTALYFNITGLLPFGAMRTPGPLNPFGTIRALFCAIGCCPSSPAKVLSENRHEATVRNFTLWLLLGSVPSAN